MTPEEAFNQPGRCSIENCEQEAYWDVGEYLLCEPHWEQALIAADDKIDMDLKAEEGKEEKHG